MCVEVKVDDKIDLRHDYSANLVYNAQHDYLCPNCNYHLNFTFGCISKGCINDYNYCPKCGAKLNWDGIKTREDYDKYLRECDGGDDIEYFGL